MKTIKITSYPHPELQSAKHLGEAVRAARTASGMTLIDAALSVGVAKQTLSDLENGKPSVSLGIALKIAAQLGVSLFVFPKESRTRVLNLIKDNDAS